ncbi:MAG: ACP S-malonyltransferase [Verrucomicrobia bacterium]|nr:ACP S-malonyltransferase [Verrucomicrobiota bacterium]
MTAYLFPGQGSQNLGMGGTLFDEFPELTTKADAILGYSVKELCLNDPQKQLVQTQFTQPALYVVEALTYKKKQMDATQQKPIYVAGHSLGEYAALFAAESFDFETGLRLVQKRGALMGQISGGGMAAIIGKSAQDVRDLLQKNHFDSIDIANFNTPKQVVIAGKKEDVLNTKNAFEQAGAMFFPLNVSGAFHSRYMTPAKEEFSSFLNEIELNEPKIPCISNYTGKPYETGQIKINLAEQLNHSVLWNDSMQYLIAQRVQNFVEVGPGTVLTGLMTKIKQSK